MAILNMVGGGGGLSATDAILRVIAPAGSTVTISKGGVSKSDQGHENASDASLYDYYFIIHASQFDSVNPWTVTATLGTQSISESIIIDTAKEYDVLISYTLYLVKDGITQGGSFVAVAKNTSSEATAGTATPNITQNTGYITMGLTASSGSAFGMTYYDVKADFSKYKHLCLTATARSQNPTINNLGMSAWTELGTYQVDNRTLQIKLSDTEGSSYVEVDQDIDISSLTDLAYIGFNFGKASNITSQIRVYDLWLEA